MNYQDKDIVRTVQRYTEVEGTETNYPHNLLWSNNIASSHYGGSTQSIDPIYSKFYYDEKKKQVVPIIAPDLSAETIWYYKEAHLIEQDWSIKANVIRQKHIDQSQSFNLYITPNTTAIELLKMYILAWESGVKTLYYTR